MNLGMFPVFSQVASDFGKPYHSTKIPLCIFWEVTAPWTHCPDIKSCISKLPWKVFDYLQSFLVYWRSSTIVSQWVEGFTGNVLCKYAGSVLLLVCRTKLKYNYVIKIGFLSIKHCTNLTLWCRNRCAACDNLNTTISILPAPREHCSTQLKKKIKNYRQVSGSLNVK